MRNRRIFLSQVSSAWRFKNPVGQSRGQSWQATFTFRFDKTLLLWSPRRVACICTAFQRRFSAFRRRLWICRSRWRVFALQWSTSASIPQLLKHTMDGSSCHKPAKYSTHITTGPGIPYQLYLIHDALTHGLVSLSSGGLLRLFNEQPKGLPTGHHLFVRSLLLLAPTDFSLLHGVQP